MKNIAILIIFSFSFCSLCRAEFVGIKKKDFEKHYRAQQGQMWCWASSAEMCLSYQGISLPQEAIVEKIKGFRVDAGGNPFEMVWSTNGIFRDTSNRKVVVSGQYVMGAPIPTVLYNHLKNKKPVILTYQNGPWTGHAVVLIGIDAAIRNDEVEISKFYVFDPFCYRPIIDWRGNRLEEDPSLIYREYSPRMSWNSVMIEAGAITGVIFIDGTKL